MLELLETEIKKEESRDFPDHPLVKNLTSKVENTESIPGGGSKISHAAWQLSLPATTTEPMGSEADRPQLERSPCATMKDPSYYNQDTGTAKKALPVTGFLGGTSGKESACKCKGCQETQFDPWVRKTP